MKGLIDICSMSNNLSCTFLLVHMYSQGYTCPSISTKLNQKCEVTEGVKLFIKTMIQFPQLYVVFFYSLKIIAIFYYTLCCFGCSTGIILVIGHNPVPKQCELSRVIYLLSDNLAYVWKPMQFSQGRSVFIYKRKYDL